MGWPSVNQVAGVDIVTVEVIVAVLNYYYRPLSFRFARSLPIERPHRVQCKRRPVLCGDARTYVAAVCSRRV